MISNYDKVSENYYNHETHKKNIGPSSQKILDGEDQSILQQKYKPKF